MCMEINTREKNSLTWMRLNTDQIWKTSEANRVQEFTWIHPSVIKSWVEMYSSISSSFSVSHESKREHHHKERLSNKRFDLVHHSALVKRCGWARIDSSRSRSKWSIDRRSTFTLLRPTRFPARIPQVSMLLSKCVKWRRGKDRGICWMNEL